MRACARDVGLLAIQAALVERCREEDLGAERKALLAALAAPGGRSVRDIAAGDACCMDAMLGAAGGTVVGLQQRLAAWVFASCIGQPGRVPASNFAASLVRAQMHCSFC